MKTNWCAFYHPFVNDKYIESNMKYYVFFFKNKNVVFKIPWGMRYEWKNEEKYS